jgi:predicted TIM-barrel fold metal-dependent hydrolase
MKVYDCEIYLDFLQMGKVYDLRMILGMMDEAGIDKAVVMPDVSHHPDNKALADKVRGNSRFIPCALINPQFGEQAVEELETGVREWGIRGLKVMPPKHGVMLVSKQLHPLMKKCSELKIPVSIHSDGGYGHPLAIGALATAFPDVPVIMDHMGYRNWVRDAIEAAKWAPNIYLATTAVMEPLFIAMAIDALGIDRLVFGSNGPMVIPKMQVEVIKYLGLSPAEEEKIFFKTLAKLYKIDPVG